MWGALIVLIIAVAIILIYKQQQAKKNSSIANYKLPSASKAILQEQVAFYRDLDDADKAIFEERIKDFLARVRITGVGVAVEDIDRILIASSAIIPIFAFKGWRYNNISEVLLYPESFNYDYQTKGDDTNVLGMVGDGALQRQMILSQRSLRAGFKSIKDAHNTAIHEFVHLIDKADGSVDGVPEYLLSKPYIVPWIKNMRQAIRDIHNGESDINPYGATNDAEFFAVVSEYFFEKPARLEDEHPELYKLLKQMFQPKNTS
jgi:Mlc titration factor MtfA (ptsG expression regulator)